MIHDFKKSTSAIYEAERHVAIIKYIARTFLLLSIIVVFVAIVALSTSSRVAHAADYVYYDNIGAAFSRNTSIGGAPQDHVPAYSTGYTGWLPLQLEGELTNDTSETCDVKGQFRTWGVSPNAIQSSDPLTVAFIAGIPVNVIVNWTSSAYGIEYDGNSLESREYFLTDCVGTVTVAESGNTIGNTTSSSSAYDTITKFSITSAYLPIVSILEPDPGEIISQANYNGTGGDAFFNFATSNFDMTENPGESPGWEMEIYESPARTVLTCSMSATRGGSVDGSNNYGVQLNHKVDGNPDPCENFALGDYSIRARVYMSGPVVSDWSDWVDFTISETPFGPVADCPVDGSFFDDFSCWITNAAIAAFVPSTGAVQGVFDVIDNIGTQFPFSWITESNSAFQSSFGTAEEDFGTPDAGNPLQGDLPNAAWIVEQVTQYYGSWASTFSAFMIWFVALISIVRSGFFFLNVPHDDGLEIGGTDED